jgi:uncharacterized protein
VHFEEPGPEDRRAVEQQLGRPLRARWRVARRCHLGIPMVVENHPLLDDGSPFPTLYWLTCPILVKRISSQEAEGGMQQLNDRLAGDEGLRSRLGTSLERLVETRDALAHIDDPGAPPGGGPDKVKCLHAHAAQELVASPNAAGSLALGDAGWPDCVAPCIGRAE